MTNWIPKEKLTAYQRWEVAAFDEQERTTAAPPPTALPTSQPPENPPVEVALEPESEPQEPPLALPTAAAVSYTHLDVYKRQASTRPSICAGPAARCPTTGPR